LDLGHTSHTEIAVAVLADLVSLRANGDLGMARGASEESSSLPATAIDLVCGMTVTADESSRPLEHEGVTYYFCAPGCRVAFAKEPERYIEEGAA
jgi:xanthine dehydrogenase accessory factor